MEEAQDTCICGGLNYDVGVDESATREARAGRNPCFFVAALIAIEWFRTRGSSIFAGSGGELSNEGIGKEVEL